MSTTTTTRTTSVYIHDHVPNLGGGSCEIPDFLPLDSQWRLAFIHPINCCIYLPNYFRRKTMFHSSSKLKANFPTESSFYPALAGWLHSTPTRPHLEQKSSLHAAKYKPQKLKMATDQKIESDNTHQLQTVRPPWRALPLFMFVFKTF